MFASSGGEKSSSTAESTSMAIAGLQLLEPGKKQPGLFNDKQENDTTATALGYVAHVSLLYVPSLEICFVSFFFSMGKLVTKFNVVIVVSRVRPGCCNGSRVFGCTTAISSATWGLTFLHSGL
jgi:hypothetical protein